MQVQLPKCVHIVLFLIPSLFHCVTFLFRLFPKQKKVPGSRFFSLCSRMTVTHRYSESYMQQSAASISEESLRPIAASTYFQAKLLCFIRIICYLLLQILKSWKSKCPYSSTTAWTWPVLLEYCYICAAACISVNIYWESIRWNGVS